MGAIVVKGSKAPAADIKIKIHGANVSTNCLPCIILASDLGVGSLEYCDLMSGAHKQPSFLKMNPFGQVPTLQDSDGFCCAESNAILRYLATKHDSELYPANDPKLRARIDWIMAAWSTSAYSKWAARVYPILGFTPDVADKEKANKDFPDYEGAAIVVGEGLASLGVQTGAAKKDEKAAKDAGVGGIEFCNLMEGAHLKPEYLAKNAFHQIPLFEDSEGYCVAESTAILRHIATNYMPALYPTSAQDKALVDWAMDLMSGSIYEVLAVKVFYPVFGFAAPPEDQKAANEACLDLLAKFEKAFLSKDKKFVAGSSISIAEYKAVPLLYACMQPAIEAKTGFKMPARFVKYVEDAMKEMKNASFLESAGGYSIKEYAASKADAPAAAEPAASIKIHGAPVSTNSLSCIILASDLGKGGLEYCDLMSGAHKEPSFLEMNAFGQVPTMQDPEGFCCAESNTILRYLAVKHGSELYPTSDAKLCARIDWVMAAWSTSVYSKWAARVYPILGFAADVEDKEKANKELKEALDNFAKAFVTKDSKFLAGDQLTIADYKVMPFLFGLSLPFVEKKSGVKLAPRLAQYVEDMMPLMKTSGILTSNGGWSIKEFVESKTDFPDFTGELVVVGEGLAASIGQKGAAKKDEKAAKIHGMPASANSVAAVLCAMDAGVGGLEFCNLMEGAHLKPEYLEKNAFHQIPLFEDSDGFCVAESTAILRYIGTNYMPSLYPTAAQDKATVDWAMDLMSGTIYEVLAVKVFYPIFGFAAPPADQKAENEACLDLLTKFEKVFLSKGKKFVAGDAISIAEYKAVPLLYACMQPSIEAKTGFKMPARMVQYVEDAMKEMKNGSFLESAGGYSIKEYAASKA